MSNEQAALSLLIFILAGFLVVGALASPNLLLPKQHRPRKAQRPAKVKHEQSLAKALAFLDATPTTTGSIYLRCSDCGGRKYQPKETAIETTVSGLVCVAVCRTCGAALVSRILKPSEAAEYVDAGSPRVWPRLVVARTELAGVHNATQFSDAVIEARRTTP